MGLRWHRSCDYYCCCCCLEIRCLLSGFLGDFYVLDWLGRSSVDCVSLRISTAFSGVCLVNWLLCYINGLMVCLFGFIVVIIT
jgi:hypothetical protein